VGEDKEQMKGGERKNRQKRKKLRNDGRNDNVLLRGNQGES
jgi:hypothetical protein